MTEEELAERVLLQRKAWDSYAKSQREAMGDLVDLYGTVEDPVSPGFFILDRAHRLMLALCRLDRNYTRSQIQVMQKMLDSLAKWVDKDANYFERR